MCSRNCGGGRRTGMTTEKLGFAWRAATMGMDCVLKGKGIESQSIDSDYNLPLILCGPRNCKFDSAFDIASVSLYYPTVEFSPFGAKLEWLFSALPRAGRRSHSGIEPGSGFSQRRRAVNVNVFDILLVALPLVFLLLGFLHTGWREFLSLVGVLLGTVVGVLYGSRLADVIARALPERDLAQVIGFLVIVAGGWTLGGLLGS